MKRRSYTAAVKVFVADLAERKGICETARFVDISKGTIAGWIGAREQLVELPPAKRACRYRVAKKPDMEEHVVKYCMELRERMLPVSLKIAYIEAMRVNEDPDRKVSLPWLWRVLRRNGFSCRAITSFGRKAYDQVVVDEFLAEYIPRFSAHKRELVLNMDETSVQFEVVPKRTFDVKGSTTTRLLTSGLEKKCFTVILTITANGALLLPYLIYKRKTIPSDVRRQDLIVNANERGWMNGTIMVDWFEKVVEPYAATFSEQNRVLLLLDSAPCHNCATQLDCDTIFVPKGHTGVLQPLDVAVIKRFKAMLRHKWMLHIIESVRTSAGPARPSYSLLSAWIAEAARGITQNIIVSGWEKSGIFPPATAAGEPQQDIEDLPDPEGLSLDEIDEIERAFVAISFDREDK